VQGRWRFDVRFAIRGGKRCACDRASSSEDKLARANALLRAGRITYTTEPDCAGTVMQPPVSYAPILFVEFGAGNAEQSVIACGGWRYRFPVIGGLTVCGEYFRLTMTKASTAQTIFVGRVAD